MSQGTKEILQSKVWTCCQAHPKCCILKKRGIFWLFLGIPLFFWIFLQTFGIKKQFEFQKTHFFASHNRKDSKLTLRTFLQSWVAIPRPLNLGFTKRSSRTATGSSWPPVEAVRVSSRVLKNRIYPMRSPVFNSSAT